MTREVEPVVAEFIRRARMLEPAYKTVRATSFLADRGGGLAPVVTRIVLLPYEKEEKEVILWESSLLKIVQCYKSFQSIDALLDSVTSGHFQIHSTYIGFYENEEPNWSYTVASRGEMQQDSSIDSTTLVLSAFIRIDNAPRSDERHFVDEMKLNPRIPFSCFRDLTGKMLGTEYESIMQKRVDILAPSYLQLNALMYQRSKMVTEIRCRDELVSSLRLKAVFTRPDGDFVSHEPRFRNPSVRRMSDGFAEITKSFKVPLDAKDAVGVDVTLSVDAHSGFDTIYSPNLSIVNPLWSILEILDKSKFSKYLELDGFEGRLVNLKGSKKFENIVAVLLASCGVTVAFLGDFPLACKDLIVTDPNDRTVFLCECTTGAPRDKFGPMKNAVENLRTRANWRDFIGVVFTSQSISKADRIDASSDSVIVKDVSDLKWLAEMAREQPNPKRIFEWLGVS